MGRGRLPIDKAGIISSEISLLASLSPYFKSEKEMEMIYGMLGAFIIGGGFIYLIMRKGIEDAKYFVKKALDATKFDEIEIDMDDDDDDDFDDDDEGCDAPFLPKNRIAKYLDN